MQKLFAWPIKPHFVNQAWGVYRPEVYSQFGFTRHNGLDHRLADDAKIYAPADAAVYAVFSQPNGGGNVLSIITDRIAFDLFTCSTSDGVGISFQAGTYRVRIDFLHLDHALVKPGDRLKVGDLIAIGDNTGFSTGPHCHTQWRRVKDGVDIQHADTNDANNSFDPTQFFDGFYAQDVPQVISSYQQIIALLKQILGL
jgi:murein DD-endopeptidase MepM/ murein hydrolase activator NlpD